MAQTYQLDKLDRKILSALMADARLVYTDLAKKLLVSPGTIHQRVAKMEQAGIIKGSKLVLGLEELGHDVLVLLGLHLTSAKAVPKVLEKLKGFPEVLDAYYTTGTYALIIKVATKSIKDYHHFLLEKLQSIAEIQSTESFICLDHPIQRDLQVE